MVEAMSGSNTQRVIVIGAGVTGLTAAYHLVRRGLNVTVMEAGQTVGGLAGSIVVDGRPVEKYYHFICRDDHELVSFVNELGLSGALHWKDAGTSCYIRGRTYPFNTPFDLMGFDAIPFIDRVRFGLHVLAARYRSGWRDLDKVTAKEWLTARVGAKAYAAIWDPLLRIKFGEFQDHVSAAWIWHRIHRVAASRETFLGMNRYGYLEQGCAMLLDGILSHIADSGRFRLDVGSRVARISTERGKVSGVVDSRDERFVPADAVVSTVAIPEFLRLVPPLGGYSEKLASMEYLNIACMLCYLDRPFTSSFWLNVNDPQIPFNGIIETTNLNERQDFDNAHFLYIPYYLHHSDPRWAYSDDQLYNECITALGKIRPDFRKEWVKNWWVSRDRHAQAICSTGFLDLMPTYQTPVPGLYLTDSSQYYPEDRTVSASVRLGREVADAVLHGLAQSVQSATF
jgi:protoporphyrinogen oxidase